MCSFFCFKQKTAFELRISDWSSDVCSSDLTNIPGAPPAATKAELPELLVGLPEDRYLNRELSWLDFNARVLALAADESLPLLERAKFLAIFARSEERRVGKEWVSTCKSRGSTDS